MIAATMPSAPSGVRSRATMSTMVATPMATVGQWAWPRLNRRSTARATRFAPSASYPLKSSSWPRMMFTPTALMKPTMTERETHRSRLPSRNIPAASITIPVRTASVNSARLGSSAV